MMAQKLYRKGYSIEEIADMVGTAPRKVGGMAHAESRLKQEKKAPGYRLKKYDIRALLCCHN